MDRRSLLRVLADSSRYAVYEELRGSESPRSIGELVERLDLHPNTVRSHLEKLRDAGLVESTPDRHGSVGRPQHLWSVRYASPALGLEPDGFRVLAHLLADLAAADPDLTSRARATGRRRGVEGTHARVPAPACLKALVDELAGLGFDPSLEPDGDEHGGSMTFRRCPFRELAAAYPDLVCQLHRGLTEGILAELSGGRAAVESFSTLVDADPCRAEVSITA